MIYTNLDKYDFRLAFLNSETYKNQFSLIALDELFDFYDNYEQSIPLDVVAICCEWTEYESIEQFNSDYSKECKTWDEVSEFTLALQLWGTDGALVLNY